jgi:hypothetical protein
MIYTTSRRDFLRAGAAANLTAAAPAAASLGALSFPNS